MTQTGLEIEPRFRIERRNGGGNAVLIIDGHHIDLGPWQQAAELMVRWLHANRFGG